MSWMMEQESKGAEEEKLKFPNGRRLGCGMMKCYRCSLQCTGLNQVRTLFTHHTYCDFAALWSCEEFQKRNKVYSLLFFLTHV